MKRRNGSGTIDQRPNGKWRVRVVVDGRRRTLGTYDDEATARRMLRAFLAEVDAGEIIAPGSVTLRSYGADWLDRREVHGSKARDKVRSIDSERSAWRRHVEPSELADLAVQSITARDVETFARWLRKREAVSAVRSGSSGVVLRPTGRTISAQVQRHVMRLLRQCLDEAVRDELLVTNPAAGYRVRGGSADVEDDWLRADELEQLLGCDAIPFRDRAAYAAAIGLALRLNDLKALRVDQVRLDDEVPGPHVRVRIAKSERVHRIPVLPWLAPWLRAQLGTLPADALWLFPREDGDRYRAERRAKGRAPIPSALERAGVDRKIRFHDLRGTCATHLALGTWGRAWPLHAIQSMLAHADQRVTERYVRRALDELAVIARETRGGPGVGPRRSRGNAQVLADAIGFEPMTFGSGGSGSSGSSREVTAGGTNGGTHAVELAHQVLEAVQAGRVERALLEQLAVAILDDELVRLALAVQEGGEHQVRRGVELATAVAAHAGDSDATGTASGR